MLGFRVNAYAEFPVVVHDGFTNAHDRSATIILQNVKKALVENKTQKVTLVGHSLGKTPI